MQQAAIGHRSHASENPLYRFPTERRARSYPHAWEKSRRNLCGTLTIFGEGTEERKEGVWGAGTGDSGPAPKLQRRRQANNLVHSPRADRLGMLRYDSQD